MQKEYDLFGNEIIRDVLLRDKFIEPPFSVLDTKSGSWQQRKNQWKKLGIKSEIGRNAKSINSGTDNYRSISKKDGYDNKDNYTSIFDPALCEVLYHWFCPQNGFIIDPFAGGSVRGIVANYLGYNYTGIDIREEQINSNIEQALDVLPITNQPKWHIGDSDKVLNDEFLIGFDFIFSCPPYADLEVYSDLPGDISNMDYQDFLKSYRSIIKKAVAKLKHGCLACFVVGEVRDKKGHYIGFVPDTIKAFIDAGMKFYNEAILLNPVASASMRADKQFTSGKKLVKTHQNILVFKKE